MIRSLNSSLENGTWHNIKLGRLHKSHCINIGEWAKWAHIERPETRKTRSYWSAHGRDSEELNFSDKETCKPPCSQGNGKLMMAVMGHTWDHWYCLISWAYHSEKQNWLTAESAAKPPGRGPGSLLTSCGNFGQRLSFFVPVSLAVKWG